MSNTLVNVMYYPFDHILTLTFDDGRPPLTLNSAGVNFALRYPSATVEANVTKAGAFSIGLGAIPKIEEGGVDPLALKSKWRLDFDPFSP